MPTGKPARIVEPARSRQTAGAAPQDPPVPGPGFDLAPPSKPRPRGLTATQKSLAALGMLAVLAAAAFVADILAAQEGYTPSGGYEQLAGDDPDGDEGSDAQAAPEGAAMASPDPAAGEGPPPDVPAGPSQDPLSALASGTPAPGSLAQGTASATQSDSNRS